MARYQESYNAREEPHDSVYAYSDYDDDDDGYYCSRRPSYWVDYDFALRKWTCTCWWYRNCETCEHTRRMRRQEVVEVAERYL